MSTLTGTRPAQRAIDFAKATLPPAALRFARRVQRYFYGYGWRRPAPLGPLPPDASPELAMVHRAWQLGAASEATQNHHCYYSITFQGFPLPGERPWHGRWWLLAGALDWRGARVLELGCNLGLLSTFVLRAGAQDAFGVDFDPMLMEANRLVQRAFRVSYRTAAWDFNDPRPWEEELAAFQPTIVTALSVLHWVRHKERFLAFLGRFDTLLFEGHDSDATEQERLERIGFRHITLVGASERGRSVFLAQKTP